MAKARPARQIMANSATLMLWLGAVAPATAQMPTWVDFSGQGTQPPSHADIDRNFVKEWESSPPKGYPTLSKQNLTSMAAAIKLYEGVVSQGGFPVIPDDNQMTVGLFSPVIAQVKKRLALSGDLRGDDSEISQNFDYGLEKGVKRFQASNGLSPNGVIDKRTIAALNVPAATRLHQLKVNLQRLNELARSMPKKYVLVNIPAAQIEAIDSDRVVSRHAGVVGKPDRQSPVLHSSITQLNFNPVWHLPPTVLSQDLIPKGAAMAAKGQDVLAKYGIDALDGQGRKVPGTKINWNASAATAY